MTGTALTGVLAAIENIPNNLVPRVLLDSQSPWANVDTIPGPTLAVWLETGAVYEVGDDGTVIDKPIRRDVEEDREILVRALSAAARALEEAGQSSSARSALAILESIQARV